MGPRGGGEQMFGGGYSLVSFLFSWARSKIR